MRFRFALTLALLLLVGSLTRAFAISTAVNLVSVNASGTGTATRGAAAISRLNADPRMISADGRFCVFAAVSNAGLVSQPTTAARDVYYRDLWTGVTQLVSVNFAGTAGGNNVSYAPTVSADGRFVAFQSTATNLTSKPLLNGYYQVYVRDMSTNTTVLCSINRTGTGPATDDSNYPVLSANGRYVAFASYATDLTANPDTNSLYDIYVRDLQTGTTVLASVTPAGTAGNGSSLVNYSPSESTRESIKIAGYNLSADGRMVVFSSRSSNLTSVPDTNGGVDLFVRDLDAGVTRLVTVNAAGTAAGIPAVDTKGVVGIPFISPDHRWVVFSSYDADLTALPDTNLHADAFARDLQTGVTTLLSTNRDGTAAATGGDALVTHLSPDGNFVALVSDATDMVDRTPPPDRAAGNRNAYLRDLRTATNVLLTPSATSATSTTSGDTERVQISANGRNVLFDATGPDITGDPHGTNVRSIYVRDIATEITQLVSRPAANAAPNGDSNEPHLSDDGRVALFSSNATNLTTVTDVNNVADVFAAAINTPPLSSDDAYSAQAGKTLNVPSPGVLANDTDADGDPLNAVLVTSPAHGSLTLNANGAFTYTSDPGFQGNDRFTYRATDGNINGTLATVTLTVNGIVPPSGLTAAVGNARVELSWQPSPDATSYNVLRSTTAGGPYVLVGGVAGTAFTDTTVSDGAPYFYVVTAVDGSGESANSNEASATLPPTYTVTGKVTAGGVALTDALVAGAGQTVTTAADGTYTLTRVSAGAYLVQAWSSGYSFANRVVTVGPSQSGVDFTAPSYLGSVFTISGKVTAGGMPLNGVMVAGAGETVTTAADGTYTLTNVSSGSYLVQAWANGYTFPNQMVQVGPSRTSVDFVAPSYLGNTFTISGKVSAGGLPLAGALVTGAGQAVTTDDDGTYTLTNVSAGYYLVQAWAAGYTFPNQVAGVGPSQSGVDFAAP